MSSFNSEDLVFRVSAKFDIKPDELKAQLEGALNKLNADFKIDTTSITDGIGNVLKQIMSLKQELESVSKINLKNITEGVSTPSKSNSSYENEKRTTDEIKKQNSERTNSISKLDAFIKKYSELDALRRKTMLTGTTKSGESEFDQFAKTNEYYKKREELFFKLEQHQAKQINLTKEELSYVKEMLAFYDKLAAQELKATFGERNTGKTRIDGDRKAEQIALYDELIRKTKLLVEIEQKLNSLDKSKHRKEYNFLSVEVQKTTKDIDKLTNSIEKQGLKSKALESQLATLSNRLNVKSRQNGMQIFDSQTQEINKLSENIRKAQAEFQKFILTNEKMSPQQIERYNRKLDELNERLKEARAFNEDVVSRSALPGIQKAVSQRFDIASSVERELNSVKSAMNKFSTQNELVIRARTEKENLDKTVANIKQQLNGLETFKLNSKFIDTTELEKYEAELKDIIKQSSKLKFDESNVKRIAASTKEAHKLKLKYAEVVDKIKELKEVEKQNNSKFNLSSGVEEYERKTTILINNLIAKKKELEAKKNTVNFLDNGELDKIISQIDNIIQKTQSARTQEIVNMASLKEANNELKKTGTEVNNINTKIKLLNSTGRIDAGIDSFITKTKDVNNSIEATKDNIKKMAMSMGNIGDEKVQGLLTKLKSLQSELKEVSDVSKTGFEIKNADANLNRIKDALGQIRGELSQVQMSGQATATVFSNVFNLNTITSYVAQFYLVRKAIRDIYEEVSLLDSAMTTLRMTMGGNEGAYLNLIDGAIDLASETGTQMDTVLDVVKTYANATDSVEEVMNKIKPTIALSNIGEMSASDAVNNIQSIMKQFKLTEKAAGDVNAATYRVTDSITAISKALQMDFGQGIREIAAGIMESGAAIEASGMSYERYAALLSAVAEQSRLSGSQWASYL